MEKIKTKEYAINDDLVINKITVNYCTESDKIKDGSVDLILTDLPYGNMNGARLDGWENNKTGWDFAIEPKKVHEIANRILRKNGKMVLKYRATFNLWEGGKFKSNVFEYKKDYEGL